MAPTDVHVQSSTFGNNHKHFEHDVGASFDASQVGSKTSNYSAKLFTFGNGRRCPVSLALPYIAERGLL